MNAIPAFARETAGDLVPSRSSLLNPRPGLAPGVTVREAELLAHELDVMAQVLELDDNPQAATLLRLRAADIRAASGRAIPRLTLRVARC